MSKASDVFNLMRKYKEINLNGINGALAQQGKPYRIKFENGKLTMVKVFALGISCIFAISNISMLTALLLSV